MPRAAATTRLVPRRRSQAAERGAYPSYKGSKWDRGIFPLDTQAHYVEITLLAYHADGNQCWLPPEVRTRSLTHCGTREAAALKQATDVAASMFVDLGRLRAFQGSQVYKIPDGVDLQQYPNVIVWCEHFGVLISPAKLSFES